MALHQLDFEGKDRVEVAIQRLRQYEPEEGYYLAFSGGKDSVTIYDLAVRACVKFDAHYNVSPIDPPEVYEFIKNRYPSIQWDKHAKGFWKRFLTEGPPMRLQRWCCGMIKEAGGQGRHIVTGIRYAESTSRKSRAVYEPSTRRPNTHFLHPIIDWSDSDVWEYIWERKLPYCSLYDEGFKRIGCVLCPFQSPKQTQRDLVKFPKIAANWRRALERYYAVRIQRGTPLSFTSAQEYWEWWLSRGSKKAMSREKARLR